MNKKFYITTPIYYPSGKFHIGTSYTEVLADTLKRYHELKGEETYLLTGNDEHGQKIETKSIEANMTPQEYVDMRAEESIKLWDSMKIEYNQFFRTTNEFHVKAVQNIFEKFLKQGDIYKGEYEGWYCEPCETYYPEHELVNGNCPECGREVKKMKEECYFFKMSKYVDQLQKYYDEHPEFIVPEYRKTEMINNFIKPGLEDLCVTRTSFKWGIPVKSDPKHVIYVWLDALTNYITALGYEGDDTTLFEKFWPADVQLVGKDIARFHLIYWPIFLMALKLPLPKTIYVHNWITMKDGKMSKSKGNVIYPEQLIARYGLDAMKYYIIREMYQSQDELFTPEDFIKRFNSDLCNDLGNLLNRTVAMCNKYFEGIVPKYNGHVNDVDKELEKYADECVENFENNIDKFEFANALQSIWNLISRTNKYIDETMPWALAKDINENEENKKKLESVIYHLIANLRMIAILIRPLLVETSDKIFKQLGIDNASIRWNDLNKYDAVDELKVIEQGEPLFMRLKPEEEMDYLKSLLTK